MKLQGALEIRNYLNCSESTLMDHIQNGGLPVKRVDAVYFADSKAVDTWLGSKEKTKEDKDGTKKAKERAKADAKTDAKTDAKADSKAKSKK